MLGVYLFKVSVPLAVEAIFVVSAC